MLSSPLVSKAGLSSLRSLEPNPSETTGAPRYVRSSRDLQPANVASARLPEIDEHASFEEKKLFGTAVDLAGGSMRAMPLRLGLMLRGVGSPSMREDFAFEGHPASVQTNGPTIVVNVGSNEDGSAGQVTMENGYVETKTGKLAFDVSRLQSAIRQASVALCLGVAREKNMPYATDALIRLKRYSANN